MSVGSAARNHSSLQIQDTQVVPLAVQTADWKHVAEPEVPGPVTLQAATDPAFNPDEQKIIIEFSAFAECLRLCLLYDAEETQDESRPSVPVRLVFSAEEDHLRTDSTMTIEEVCA